MPLVEEPDNPIKLERPCPREIKEMAEQLPRQFCLMASYNQWMNENIYTAAAKLTDAQRKADRGAFFSSIHGTLNHLLFGDMIWFGRFINQPAGFTRHDVTIHEDFDDLWAARRQLDRDLLDWTARFTTEWLDAPFHYKTMAGQDMALPAFILVTQLFNHGTHHRGQVTTLLSQAGIDPGITDIPWLPDLARFAV
jgi:uncharacterized damage-inducible protein DinB